MAEFINQEAELDDDEDYKGGIDENDEDDDDDANQAEFEGFIDDKEESRKRKANRQEGPSKKPNLEDSDEERELDRDDYDLIGENVGEGISRTLMQSNKRRLHRSDDEEDDDDDDMLPARTTTTTTATTASQPKEAIQLPDRLRELSDDEDDDDGMDDFIEDDDAMQLTEAQRKERRAQRKAKRSAMQNMSAEARLQMQLFGSLMDDDLELDLEEDLMREEEPAAEQAEARFDPTELAERFQLKTDMDIIDRDVPERVQLEQGLTEPMSDELLQEEVAWIFANAFEAPWISMWTDPILMRTYKDTRRDYTRTEECIAETLKLLHYDRPTQDNDAEEAGPREVPFLATYRKELVGFPDVLNMHDLYLIKEYDLKFVSLQKRKQQLVATVERLAETIETMELDKVPEQTHVKSLLRQDVIDGCRAIRSEQELQDYSNFVNFFFGEFIAKLDLEDNLDNHDSNSGPKRRKKKLATRYHLACKLGVVNMVQHFGIHVHDVAANVKAGYSKVPVQPSSMSAFEAAMHFTTPAPPYSDDEKVTELAQHCFAREIAQHPVIRASARTILLPSMMITVRPTKTGFQAIEDWDALAKLRFITNKPVTSLYDEAFLRLIKAKKDGLLDYHLQANSDGVAQWKHEIKLLFEPEEPTEQSRAWAKIHTAAVDEAVDTMLLPALIKEVELRLQEEAQIFVLEQCSNTIRDLVSHAPYQPAHELQEGREEGVRVVTIRLGSRDTPTHFVILNGYGDVQDFLKLDNLHLRANSQSTRDAQLREKDDDSILKFLSRHRPDVIGIVADRYQVRGFVMELRKLIDELVEEDDFPNIDVEYLDAAVAELYASSSYSNREFPDYEHDLKVVIAAGRQMQAPEVAVAALFTPQDDVLCLSMHPLQDMLKKDVLKRHLTHEMMTAVNRTCVDIDAAINKLHVSPVLQFVCGLGPRKAAALVKHVQTELRMQILNRDQLRALRGCGPSVAYSAAGFVVIHHETSVETDQDVTINRLDALRIHPESYTFAEKIALDALGYGEAIANAEEQRETTIQAVEEILQPEGVEALERIAGGLADYNEQLKQIWGDRLKTLQDICEEFKHPLRDTRHAYRSLREIRSDELSEDLMPQQLIANNEIAHKLFCLMTGLAAEHQNPTAQTLTSMFDLVQELGHNRNELYFHMPLVAEPTLTTRQLVDGEVLRLERRRDTDEITGATLRLNNGILAYLPVSEISDKREIDVEERIQDGMLVQTRVQTLRLERFQCVVSSKTSTLQAKHEDGTPWSPQDWAWDPDYDMQAHEEYVRELQKDDESKYKYKIRSIGHPLFKNYDLAKACRELEGKSIGDALFRPSSQGPNFLTCTWKVGESTFQHVRIQEDEAAKLDSLSLSSRLMIDNGSSGTEEFEDLDEIIARWIQPMAAHITQLRKQKKFFKDAPAEDVAQELIERKHNDTGRIPYMISPIKNQPGRYWLQYVPKLDKASKLRITVVPDGYRMCGQMFTHPGQLINWFKKNYKRLPKSQPPRQQAPATTKPAAAPAPTSRWAAASSEYRSTEFDAREPRAASGWAALPRSGGANSSGGMHPARQARVDGGPQVHPSRMAQSQQARNDQAADSFLQSYGR
eukprot:TRINITY_DN12178_c0_g1_i1.p1 TRINITY_DN12178_c0_g1~~TRINITY_DN12178_c0_g1_i1.p1  ORF type:complete len:1596 (+),score=552.73 TRINITY_DN12178_c0_g1_i1:100-4887(+)